MTIESKQKTGQATPGVNSWITLGKLQDDPSEKRLEP
jgi:hypothetical protein